MRNLIILVIIGFLAIGCSRKSAPTIIYQDKIVNSVDTVIIQSRATDTIPCDDFEIYIENEVHDTVYIKVVDKVVSVKYVKIRDTVYRETIIVQPTPRKSVIKTDNSVTAKKGSIIGNDNAMTTKNNNWWWIFLAGMLTWFIIQNVVFKVAKKYIPILNFLP
jgi:uncharacterized protein YcfL